MLKYTSKRCFSAIPVLFLTGFLCVTERDEATTESSDHNATSSTEADKRVKRRLSMGNSYTLHRMTA